jgi:serine/threonine-protein kinase
MPLSLPEGACPRCAGAHPPEGPCAADGGRSRVGQVIGGKYRLERPLGTGGMGEVYEARHTFIGRRFAVKLLLPQYANQREMLTRFQREAQAAGALESEHVTAVTDFGFTDDGAPYLLMEHLDGEDLGRLLVRTGPLDVARAVDLTIQACRGLAVAHRHGIIHRDLKPENLFVVARSDGSDLLKLLDFGIAKLRDRGGAGAAAGGALAADTVHDTTRSGSALGTPCYMPPEQARGERDIDHRADIYALGVILYEMLSREKPHNGDSYNAILFHILTQAPTPLETLRDGLPPGLIEVVARAMAFDRDGRYAGAAELAEALAPFVGGARAVVPAPAAAGTPSRAVARTGAATMPAPETGVGPAVARTIAGASARPAPASAAPSAAPPPAQRRRRGRGVAFALAALALAAAGAGVLARDVWRAPAPAAVSAPAAAAPPAGLAPPPIAPAAPVPPPAASPPAIAASTAASPAGDGAASRAVAEPPPARHAPPSRGARERARRARATRSAAHGEGLDFDLTNPYAP